MMRTTKTLFVHLSIILTLSLPNLNTYLFSHVIAQENDEEEESENGNLNLCNFDHIKKFSGNGTLISSWGKKGSADGEFLHPHAIATDSMGNVYVTDEER